MGRAGRARRCHRALLVRLRTACRALATSWCAHRRATAGASGRLGLHRTTGCHLRLESLSPGRWPAIRQPSPRPLVPLQKQRRRRRPAWPCGMAARGKTRPQRPLGGGSGPAARWPTSFCLRRAFLEAERAFARQRPSVTAARRVPLAPPCTESAGEGHTCELAPPAAAAVGRGGASVAPLRSSSWSTSWSNRGSAMGSDESARGFRITSGTKTSQYSCRSSGEQSGASSLVSSAKRQPVPER